jgi:hypothetical protein
MNLRRVDEGGRKLGKLGRGSWGGRSAQEESKMSDLAVREYADLVRLLELQLTNSAERPSINEQAPPIPKRTCLRFLGVRWVWAFDWNANIIRNTF